MSEEILTFDSIADDRRGPPRDRDNRRENRNEKRDFNRDRDYHQRFVHLIQTIFGNVYVRC